MAKGSKHDVIGVGGVELDQIEEAGQESLDGRIARRQPDEVFDGYGLLTAADIVELADGQLSTS